MKKEYDFSKSKRNTYSSILKKTVPIRPGQDAIEFFKNLVPNQACLTSN